MKAIVYTKYGAPEVLQLTEVEKPSPKDNEVLIKMFATTVTSGDCRMRRADPFLVRLIGGFFKPKNTILGVDMAGEIDEIGSAVTKFKKGDPVFGSSYPNFGCYAEYNCVPDNSVLIIKPTNITYEEAAAIFFWRPYRITFS